MRFREVKEVKEIKETNTREKGLGVLSKLDVIEGRVSAYQNIKPSCEYTDEEIDVFWDKIFQSGEDDES